MPAPPAGKLRIFGFLQSRIKSREGYLVFFGGGESAGEVPCCSFAFTDLSVLSDQNVYCWRCTVDNILILLHSDV